MKWALALEYVGSHYHGWQLQNNVTSVQAQVEMALAKLAGHPVQVFCAGRTDRGVHATHQVVHFETTTEREERAWVLGTNAHLPRDIKVIWAKQVPQEFHARFSAISRGYHYLIYNHTVRPTHFIEGITWCAYPLSVPLMQKAANVLIGTHDFSSFRDKECQAKHPVRTLELIEITQRDRVIKIELKANAFLHHMVRNIVGTLLPIGQGLMAPESMQIILNAKQRSKAGATASWQGLYLTEVNYPEPFVLPSAKSIPWVCC